MQLQHKDYIKRIEHHIKADNLIRGAGWEKGKGCAIGCSFEYYDHAKAANETNVPEWFWRLEDTLFEGMNKDKADSWPMDVFRCDLIRKSIDENSVSSDFWAWHVQAPFLIMVLNSALESFNHDKYPDVRAAIEASIALWQRNNMGTKDWQKAAGATAEAASWAAEAAAWAAEAATWAAWAAEAAEAAWAAGTAWAAGAAEAAGAAAEAAEAAAEAAGAVKYDYFADELLRILDEAAMVHSNKE